MSNVVQTDGSPLVVGSQTREPLLSVIIPAKNAARYVGDALHSLSLQCDDKGSIEVVFIDDGSDDDTLAIAERALSAFPRSNILSNPVGKGVYAARNQGLEVAKGRYISLLDADDWFAPGHLAFLAHEMDRIGCDFIRTDVVESWGTRRRLRYAPQGRRGVSLFPRDSILPIDTYTMVDHPWSQAGIYHRRLIDSGLLRYPLGAETAEDRPWIWGMFLKADSYAVVDSPGFIWRKGVETSLTSALDHRRLGYIVAFDRVRSIVEADREAEQFLPKVVQSVLAITNNHLEHWDRFPDDVKSGLIEGVQTLLRKFPRPMVEQRVAACDDERKKQLSRILGGLYMESEGS